MVCFADPAQVLLAEPLFIENAIQSGDSQSTMQQEDYLRRKCRMAKEQGESLLLGERLILKCSKSPVSVLPFEC